MNKVAFESRVIKQNGELISSFFNLEKNKEYNLLINKGENIDLLIESFETSTLNIEVRENANVNVAILCKNNVNNAKITAKVAQNANISLYFADFSLGQNKVEIVIDLNEENAHAEWHLSSLSSKGDDKEFSVFINHNNPRTFATSDNYGVCKDNGRLVFSGTSYILKGNKKSETIQNARIMVFDPDSVAVAKPILKIDENDLLASHAAVVGKINDEHLFYLTSRGLKENEAKSLITYSYLKPITKGFIDENIQNEIINLIEDKM